MSQIIPQSKAQPVDVLGIDVAKDSVVIHDGLTGRSITVANSAAALKRGLQPFRNHGLAVCEVTGGYERLVLAVAQRIALPIHRAHPNRIKAFITSHGSRAKTDAIDAKWLARYAQERADSLEPWKPPHPLRSELMEMARHRDNLLNQRTQAKNRLAAPSGTAIKAMLRRQIAFLSQQIKTAEDACADIIQRIDGMAEQYNALHSIPGIGPATARTLLALMPELGTLSVKQAAALAGLAPHPRQSGTYDARRTMTGGRPEIRRALFMAALSASKHHPDLKEFYQRLVSAGKPPKLAIAAVARKLIVIANATIKTKVKLT